MPILPDDAQRGTLVALEPRIRAAFHPLYHEIARRRDLSAGAKVVYAVLCSYHQMFDDVFPGRERLARDAGEPQRSLTRYLAELKTIGLLSVARRGLGLTNVYTLLAWPRGWANLAIQPGQDGLSGSADVANPIPLVEEEEQKEIQAIWQEVVARATLPTGIRSLFAELPARLDGEALIVPCPAGLRRDYAAYVERAAGRPVRWVG